MSRQRGRRRRLLFVRRWGLPAMIGDPGAGAQWAAVIKMAELRRGECQDVGVRGVARSVHGGWMPQEWRVSLRVRPEMREEKIPRMPRGRMPGMLTGAMQRWKLLTSTVLSVARLFPLICPQETGLDQGSGCLLNLWS